MKLMVVVIMMMMMMFLLRTSSRGWPQYTNFQPSCCPPLFGLHALLDFVRVL